MGCGGARWGGGAVTVGVEMGVVGVPGVRWSAVVRGCGGGVGWGGVMWGAVGGAVRGGGVALGGAGWGWVVWVG